ncbi:carbon-nitrogen hydrolase family protein [Methanomicrobium antiquum]|uniref:Carbon-nitrogen hydrolase family protein n=1 Tax=Methanomicrobium antiquum TaxID=487686 RepID=A0AAF0JMA9_9EURY|nr:nitrilase-related carbon-nitrogen hydrolase [Methanomicrobium antiquum]WFN36957.1 carbon-nitrogen hydrolase family protein [Methanomicrobium antiquum]
MSVLKLCLAQTNPVWEKPEKNLSKFLSYTKEASKNNADIIIFSEQAATGWNPLSDKNISDENGPIPKAFSAIASEFNIGILGAFRETGKDLEKPKNTSVFFSDSGEILSKYSKIHLFNPGGENKCFSPGDVPSSFTYKGVKFGLSICYDLRFSDLFTYYAKEGCGCVFVQAAWPKLRMDHWRTFIHSRAIENQFFIAGINTTGKTPVDEYCGGSTLVGPSGETVLEADEKEGLFYGEIDTQIVLNKRDIFNSLSDRRDDLYIEWQKK